MFGTDEQRATLAAMQTPLMRGIESARAKMAAWGEEWADEEELPIAFGSGSNANLSRKSLNKIQRQAEARVDKLKVEKRNTKYKGVL